MEKRQLNRCLICNREGHYTKTKKCANCEQGRKACTDCAFESYSLQNNRCHICCGKQVLCANRMAKL